jgi:hypothetical protein
MHEHATLHLCPRCLRKTGSPYRVVPDDPGNLRLLVRCDACRHRWSLIVPKDSVADAAVKRLTRQSEWPSAT